jgi:hypothetical protein
MALHFDPDAHVYTFDGRRVPSVTQLLAPIAQDFSMVPAGVLEAKRILGTVVHEACQYDDEGDLDDETVPAEVDGYLSAWRKFRADTGACIIANEKQMYHADLQYAGTVDRVASFDGEMWVLDLKTSAAPAPSYGVQLAGYAGLLAANGLLVPLRRATVHLFNDGGYKLVEFKNPADTAAFRACLAIWNWKEATK